MRRTALQPDGNRPRGNGQQRQHALGALAPPVRVRLYEHLVTQLLDHIREAGYRPGDKFPPERLLAERFAVSRASVRQALAVMEAQGFLEARHGDGIYVLRTASDAALATLMDRRRRIPEILEVREALETKLAELAADRRTDKDVAAIQASVDGMAADIGAGGLGAEADAAFHAAIAAAAKNPLLEGMMQQLADAIRETRMQSLSEPGRPPRSLAAHRRIATAIIVGDSQAARRAMRDHLRVVADVWLLRWEPERRRAALQYESPGRSETPSAVGRARRSAR